MRLLTCGIMLMGLAAIVAAPADPKATFTDPEQAGPDFAIQGEYEGAAGDKKAGAQVVAYGGGTFTVRVLAGGLPGAGWDGKTQFSANGKTEGNKVLLTGKDFSGEIADGALTAKIGSDEYKLKKVIRKSPTENMAPPEGAVVLFDGTEASAAKWTNGKLVEGKYLNWGVKSKEAFGDAIIHLEFRLPFMPGAKGQARANSGVYIQDRYELQILDSFALKGLNNEAGGFYQQADPLVNMCFPPLSWQTYDIDFTAAKFDDSGKKIADAIVTVKHNGVVVQDKLALKKETPGGQKESPKPGVLQFQNHGNPVVFRNVWVLPKK